MNKEIFNKINRALQETGAETFLVGGYIRDMLLGRDLFDIDLIVYGQRDIIALLNNRLHCALVCLDEARDIYRFVKRGKGNTYTIDITLEDQSVPIEQNLIERDFTINAMAVRLNDFVTIDFFDIKSELLNVIIDPFHGIDDINNGIIRMTRQENLVQDPLRLCRAFRFGSQFGFDIHQDTLKSISDNALLIKYISPERIHEELVKMLKAHASAAYVKQMKEAGLLAGIFPEINQLDGVKQCEMHIYDVWEHSWHTLLYLEELLEPHECDFTGSMAELIRRVKSRFRESIHCLKIAALLHDVGKPMTKDIGKKGQITFYRHAESGVELLYERLKALCFSNKEVSIVTRLVKRHMRPILLSKSRHIGKNALARLFVDINGLWPALLLLSVADVWATRRDESEVRDYIGYIISIARCMEEMEKIEEGLPIISGQELIEMINFPEGPLMGRALAVIKLGCLTGRIRSKEDALKTAKSVLFSRNKSNVRKEKNGNN